MSLLVLLLFCVPVYVVFRLARFKVNWANVLILALILAGFLGLAVWLARPWILFAGGGLTLFFFVLFYDDEPFRIELRWLLPVLLITPCFALLLPMRFAFGASFLFALFFIWAWKRALTWPRALLVALLFVALSFVSPLYLQIILNGLSFIALDGLMYSIQKHFDINSRAFQQSLLSSHYQEVKEIYLQMRSWRHDYHNHLQSFKAYLAQGQIKELGKHLNELEAELDSIDTLVNSGNAMVDAILNSKLSLAKKHGIDLNVKVAVLADLPISDVDLCVILGNLLDNAIESCRQIEPGERWLRVYFDTQGEQLYLSIQNAAKEILNFNERHYISTKRGDHGLGLKRVKLLLEKYQGFLNLQNEPGIFAAEVSVPLGH